MNRPEETMLAVEPNMLLMDNIEYIMGSVGHFEVPTRLEDVFTASELRCGREGGSAFTLVDFSQDGASTDHLKPSRAATSSSGHAVSIPTVEINDSDEDVIFVAEYNNASNEDEDETVPEAQTAYHQCFASRRDGSSSSSTSSAAASPGGVAEANEPRRNPTRNARNKKYRKKCSEYITEEDLNMLIASDEENSAVDTVEETVQIIKEPRHKKVVVKNWPAEGLHERPEYNEQTEEIEKFDFSIRQIQNSAKKIKVEKPKKMKAAKKKYVHKKFDFKKSNKNTTKKKEVEMASFEDLSELISETFDQLTGTFVENLVKGKRFHTCPPQETKENDESLANVRGQGPHSQCLKNYEELLHNQSQLYALVKQDVDFNETNQHLKKKFENLQI